jgi:endoglucanase
MVGRSHVALPSVCFSPPPSPQSGQAKDAEWDCFATGGDKCTADMGVNYTASGMAQLLQAVRGAGANNVVIIGGLQWSNDLSQWLQHMPVDPLNNTGAVWHR